MRLLFDTHLLLWAASSPQRLPDAARHMIENVEHVVLFSVASIWEVAIKSGLGRADFQVDPALLRRGLLDAGYDELGITGQHVVGVTRLPPIHRDPFDRLLVAQALVEDIVLLTADPALAQYGGLVRLV